MNVRELRIGNLVRLSGSDKAMRTVISFPMDSDGNLHLGLETVDGQNTRETLTPQDVSPIPLTPQLLEKLGFKKEEPDVYYMPDDRGFYIIEFTLSNTWETQEEFLGKLFVSAEDGMYCVSKSPIESLHQLQNVYFDLIGRELDVSMLDFEGK